MSVLKTQVFILQTAELGLTVRGTLLSRIVATVFTFGERYFSAPLPFSLTRLVLEILILVAVYLGMLFSEIIILWSSNGKF